MPTAFIVVLSTNFAALPVARVHRCALRFHRCAAYVHRCGKEKQEILLYDEDAYDYYDEDELSQEYNLFDKSDMDSSDATWKRLQVGWQIGVNARFSGKFMVGLSYGSDFSEIRKKVKVNTTSISLGYCF